MYAVSMHMVASPVHAYPTRLAPSMLCLPLSTAQRHKLMWHAT